MVLYGLSARTTNMPGLEYIAVRIFSGVARPSDAHEGFVGGLAGDQRDIELAGFQQRNVLVAALGVARLDRQRRVGCVHRLGKGIAIEREAAARRGGPQADGGL